MSRAPRERRGRPGPAPGPAKKHAPPRSKQTQHASAPSSRHAPGARHAPSLERPASRQHAAHPPKPGVLRLPEALEARLSAGHPWIYRDHVPPAFRAESGAVVEIESGRFSGFALWDADSPVALRVLSRAQRPDAAWVKARLDEAWELRRRMMPERTNAFRLLFGEGDALPGVVVDVYAGFAVIVSYSASVERIAAWVAEALSTHPEIAGVYAKVTRRKDRTAELRLLHGQPAPEPLLVLEHGLSYEVDLAAGQKTGLFLDHRDNRRYLRDLAKGKRVLNLFAYTGAFSLSCAAGGASQVTSVDIAAPAIEAAARNFAHNGLALELHEGVALDVFEFLQNAASQGRRWDLVIADPPSFASSRSELFGALRAYKKLHAAALSVLEPGGLYAGASCTSQVSPDAFRQTMAEGAARVGRRLTVVHEAAHAPDHPYAAGHLEGRYLKFVLCRALPLC